MAEPQTAAPLAPAQTAPVQEKQSITISIPKIDVKAKNPQTRLLIWGISFPLFIAWLGYWLAFQLAPTTGMLNSEVIRESLPIGFKILAFLGFWGGILYVLSGLALIVLAFFLFHRAFKKSGLSEMTFAELRVHSLLLALIFFFLLIILFQLFLQITQLGMMSTLLNSFVSMLSGLGGLQ